MKRKIFTNYIIWNDKKLFTEMFKVQEETIRKLVSSCKLDTIVSLDRLAEEIQDNNER